jgi:hypothetical protein
MILVKATKDSEAGVLPRFREIGISGASRLS